MNTDTAEEIYTDAMNRLDADRRELAAVTAKLHRAIEDIDELHALLDEAVSLIRSINNSPVNDAYIDARLDSVVDLTELPTWGELPDALKYVNNVCSWCDQTRRLLIIEGDIDLADFDDHIKD